MVESEELREYYNRVYERRGVIAAIGSIIVILIFGTSDSDSIESDVAHTESTLAELATTINQLQLADPSQIDRLIDEIDSAQSTVAELVDSQSVEDKRMENQRVDARITAIETASEYYTVLRDILDDSRTLRQSLNEREENTIFEQSLEPHIQSGRFEEVSAEVTTVGPDWVSDNTDLKESTVTPLLPNLESVTEELQNQIVLYRSHVEMQESYINAGDRIHTALESRETKEYEMAMSELEAAETTVDVTIPQAVSELGLGGNSMTLAQYEQVFTNYQSAISRFAAASEPPVEPSDDNEAVSRGLETLMETRALVTEGLVQ